MSLKERIKGKITVEEKEKMFTELQQIMMNYDGENCDIRAEVNREVGRYLKNKLPAGQEKKEEMAQEVFDKLYSLGPLEKYLRDELVTDIDVNGTYIRVQRGQEIIKDKNSFQNVGEVLNLIDRMSSLAKTEISRAEPAGDLDLPGGYRAFVAIPELVLEPTIVIRTHHRINASLEELAEGMKGLTPEIISYLKRIVKERKNILFVGGTGTGKTTFINGLGKEFQENHRVCVLEDTREVILPQEDVRYFKTRDEGKYVKAITYNDLVNDCLRCNPDRIVMTEIRDKDPKAALNYITGLNTGHRGSVSTIHANSALASLDRLAGMIRKVEPYLHIYDLRKSICVLDVLVYLTQEEDEKGTKKLRKLNEIIELKGLDKNGDYDYEWVFKEGKFLK